MNIMDVFREIHNEYIKQGKSLADSGSKLPPVLIIVGRYDRRYVVASLDFASCVKGDHLCFSAFYKTDEMPDGERISYTVALPLSLYEGFELHPWLPKTLKNEYKKGDFGFLPRNTK